VISIVSLANGFLACTESNILAFDNIADWSSVFVYMEIGLLSMVPITLQMRQITNICAHEPRNHMSGGQLKRSIAATHHCNLHHATARFCNHDALLHAGLAKDKRNNHCVSIWQRQCKCTLCFAIIHVPDLVSSLTLICVQDTRLQSATSLVLH
jgi:hypothetical protein